MIMMITVIAIVIVIGSDVGGCGSHSAIVSG